MNTLAEETRKEVAPETAGTGGVFKCRIGTILNLPDKRTIASNSLLLASSCKITNDDLEDK